MKQTRKNLKITSILILVFAALSLFNILAQIAFVDVSAEIPEETSESIILITKIVVAAISFVILLPQLYVGIKGIKMAKRPDSSHAHITWATVLLVLSVIGLISPVRGLLSGQNILSNLGSLLTLLVDVILYYDYRRFAKALAR